MKEAHKKSFGKHLYKPGENVRNIARRSHWVASTDSHNHIKGIIYHCHHNWIKCTFCDYTNTTTLSYDMKRNNISGRVTNVQQLSALSSRHHHHCCAQRRANPISSLTHTYKRKDAFLSVILTHKSLVTPRDKK